MRYGDSGINDTEIFVVTRGRDPTTYMYDQSPAW